MKVRELLEKLKAAPSEAPVFIAEVDEAFAADIVEVELIENARRNNSDARAPEVVELAEGDETVIVIRW